MTASQPAWRVEAVRCTAFLEADAAVRRGTWERVVGEPAETVTESPRVQSVREIGPFKAGQLELTANPVRVDWRYASQFGVQSGGVDEINFDGLGPLPEALDSLTGIVESWFAPSVSVSRLALGAVLHLPVESTAAAYRMLDQMLPGVEVPAEGASDFVFQVNRPRAARSVDGLPLNRLSKWSAAKLVLQIQAEGHHKQVLLDEPLVASRLELDVNTAPEWKKPLPDLSSVWRELSALATEIASKGDVP